MGARDATDEAYWRAVGAAYPVQRPLLNLNNAAASPPPLVVEQAAIHTAVDGEDLGAVSLFSINGLDCRAIENELRENHQVHVKHRRVRDLEGMRVSPHIYLQEQDLDRFVAALEKVAGSRS